jgi:hypothetical protein
MFHVKQSGDDSYKRLHMYAVYMFHVKQYFPGMRIKSHLSRPVLREAKRRSAL